jgi:DNA-binding beta-propeller fold protein YncE
VIPSRISRRALLLSSAAAVACRTRRATGFLGYCFVANQGGRSVTAVDLDRFSVRKQIPLDAAPAAVLPHPAKPRAFVLAPQSGTVYEIDAATLAVARRARAGNEALEMRLSPRGDALWVLYRDPAALVELPLDSLRPARRIRLAAPPDSFDLSSDSLAAITSRQDRTIALASLSREEPVRTIRAGDEPSIVRFQSDGKQLIAGSTPERSVTLFDSASGRIVVRLPLPVAPRHFCTSADGGQLFVTGDGMDAVVIVFPYSTEVDQTILAGRAPGAMATTDRYLLVANPDTNGITVFDIDSRGLVALVQVGEGPCHILITPDQQYALVLDQKSGDVAVIRIFSLQFTPNGSQRRYKAAPLFTMIPLGDRPVGAAVVAWG